MLITIAKEQQKPNETNKIHSMLRDIGGLRSRTIEEKKIICSAEATSEFFFFEHIWHMIYTSSEPIFSPNLLAELQQQIKKFVSIIK